jgi:hypothetical protein
MTDVASEEVWIKITGQLCPGLIVRNWGLARGYIGGSFEILDIEQTAITVAGGSMQMPRRISKGDFQKVNAVWDAYVQGNYPRSRLIGLSQNTTYILSILRRVRDFPAEDGRAR